jgi:FkbM family methyltransferase
MTRRDELERSGHSTTGRAWVTNPIRKAIYRVIRPYFHALLADIDRVDESVRKVGAAFLPGRGVVPDLCLDPVRSDQLALEHRLAAIEDALGASEASASVTLATRPTGEVSQRDLDLCMDAVRSDQLALGHRLAAIEDALGAQAGKNTLIEFRERLDRWHDGLAKDQLAMSLRLGRIEDDLGATQDERWNALGQVRDAVVDLDRRTAEAAKGLAETLSDLEQRAAALAVEVAANRIHGIATLGRSQPLAIRGTSLLLHDGPYGIFLLRQPDLIRDEILRGGFWDTHLKSVIEKAAASDRSALDAGAYLGFHTVYMSRFFRTVHAFEPQVEMFRILGTNLLLNNCHNVTAVNSALYDVACHLAVGAPAQQEVPVPLQDGRTDYDHIGNAAALMLLPCAADAVGSTPALRVDDLGLSDLGLMKVDAQGSDLRVMRGAEATIRRCRPVIVAEFERDLSTAHGTTLEDYRNFFGGLGYRMETLADRGEGKQIDFLATPD